MQHAMTQIIYFTMFYKVLPGFCCFSPAETAETTIEILSPQFLPFVQQKYLSARQKTNPGCCARCSIYVILPTSRALCLKLLQAVLFEDMCSLCHSASLRAWFVHHLILPTMQCGKFYGYDVIDVECKKQHRRSK